MPQPTKQTSDIFDIDDNVRSLEMLPIPSVAADFMFNLNTEVLWKALGAMWEDIFDPIAASGFGITEDATYVTIGAGTLYYMGYRIVNATPEQILKTSLVSKQVRVRITDSQHTLENDPDTVRFQQPGYPTYYSGANYRIYTWEFAVVNPADATPTPTQPPVGDEYAILDIPLATTDGAGDIDTKFVVPATLKLAELLTGKISNGVLIEAIPDLGVVDDTPLQDVLEVIGLRIKDTEDFSSEASNGLWKIDITPDPAEVDVKQIVSRTTDGKDGFSVDERGLIEVAAPPRILYQNDPWRNLPYGSQPNVMSYASMPSAAVLVGAPCTVLGKRKVIYINRNTNIAYKFDVDSMTYEDTYNLTPDLYVGYTWYAVNAIGEDKYLYCYFTDTINRMHIQAWDVSTWTRKSGWTSTGVFSSGLQEHPLDSFSVMMLPMGDMLISVDGARNGNVQSWFKSDGSSAYGNINNSKGNWVLFSATNIHEDVGMCTDGRYIYLWAQHYTLSTSYLHSIDTAPWPGAVSNIGCPGTGHPLSLDTGSADYKRSFMAAVMGRVVIGHPTEKYFWVASPYGSARIALCSFGTAVSGGPFAAISTGTHIWMLISVYLTDGSTPVAALFKLDPYKIKGGTGPAEAIVSDVETYGEIFVLDEREISMYAPGKNYTSLVFDGRDIFVPGCVDADVGNKNIFRFANVMYR